MNAVQQVGHVSVRLQLQNTIGFVNCHRYILLCHSAVNIHVVEATAIKLAK